MVRFAVEEPDGSLQRWGLSTGARIPVLGYMQGKSLRALALARDGAFVAATDFELFSAPFRSEKVAATQVFSSAITCLSAISDYMIGGFANGDLEIRDSQLGLLKRLPAQGPGAITNILYLDQSMAPLYTSPHVDARVIAVRTSQQQTHGWFIPKPVQQPWEYCPLPGA